MFVNILGVCTWYWVHSSLMCSILGVGSPSGPIIPEWYPFPFNLKYLIFYWHKFSYVFWNAKTKAIAKVNAISFGSLTEMPFCLSNGVGFEQYMPQILFTLFITFTFSGAIYRGYIMFFRPLIWDLSVTIPQVIAISIKRYRFRTYKWRVNTYRSNKTIWWEKCKSLFVEKFSIKNNNVFYKVMAHNVR